jgi:hypothetical protein
LCKTTKEREKFKIIIIICILVFGFRGEAGGRRLLEGCWMDIIIIIIIIIIHTSWMEFDPL